MEGVEWRFFKSAMWMARGTGHGHAMPTVFPEQSCRESRSLVEETGGSRSVGGADRNRHRPGRRQCAIRQYLIRPRWLPRGDDPGGTVSEEPDPPNVTQFKNAVDGMAGASPVALVQNGPSLLTGNLLSNATSNISALQGNLQPVQNALESLASAGQAQMSLIKSLDGSVGRVQPGAQRQVHRHRRDFQRQPALWRHRKPVSQSSSHPDDVCRLHHQRQFVHRHAASFCADQHPPHPGVGHRLEHGEVHLNPPTRTALSKQCAVQGVSNGA